MNILIFVNGETHALPVEGGAAPSLTYDRVAELAGLNPEHCPSITYSGRRHGDMQRSGILSHGHMVEVEDGMRFTAVYTNNA